MVAKCCCQVRRLTTLSFFIFKKIRSSNSRMLQWSLTHVGVTVSSLEYIYWRRLMSRLLQLSPCPEDATEPTNGYFVRFQAAGFTAPASAYIRGVEICGLPMAPLSTLQPNAPAGPLGLPVSRKWGLVQEAPHFFGVTTALSLIDPSTSSSSETSWPGSPCMLRWPSFLSGFEISLPYILR